MTIRTLDQNDFDAYHDFLFIGVRDQPSRFRITADEVASRQFRIVADEHGFTLADETASAGFRGVVTIERERHRTRRQHVAWVYRMFVAPRFAGQGIGRTLLMTATEMSRRINGIEQLNLTVIADNERAIHLYHSLGFVTFSREIRAIRHDDAYRDELQMQLFLS